MYGLQAMDWFGYVTPANLAGHLDRRWDDSAIQRWRCRWGVSKEQLSTGVGPAAASPLASPCPPLPQERQIWPVVAVAAIALVAFAATRLLARK
jgi:hypothetical protein